MRIIRHGSPEELDLDIALRAYKDGRLDAARLALTKLADKFPDDDRVVGKLSYVQFELGDYPAALLSFARATALEPKRELWSIGLFHTHWRLGSTQEAFVEARRYLTLHPGSPECNQLLTEMKEELGAK